MRQVFQNLQFRVILGLGIVLATVVLFVGVGYFPYKNKTKDNSEDASMPKKWPNFENKNGLFILKKESTKVESTHPEFIFTNVPYLTLQELVQRDRPKYELDRIELIPFKNSDSLFVAHLVFEPSWWSSFSVGRYIDGKIQWLRIEDTVKMANYILSIKEIQLNGFENPIIEVYDSTHMGNGSFYLFEVNKYTLALLVKTRAVDSLMDGATHPLVCGDRAFSASSSLFRDQKLAVEYADVNNDGIDDFTLSGVIDIYCNGEFKGDGMNRKIDDSDYLYKSVPAKKVFLFDAKEREERGFKEDIAQKVGFDEWHKLIQTNSLIKNK